MQLNKPLQKVLGDSLYVFRLVQGMIAGICILIPFIFWVTDKDTFYPKRLDAAATLQSTHAVRSIHIDSTSTNSDNKSRLNFLLQDSTLTIQIDALSKIEKDAWGFRYSISHYTYSTNAYLYGLFYCMAAMMYIFNGVVYLREKSNLTLNSRLGPWLNIITGISLLLVVWFPLYGSEIPHFVFTALFFLGNLIMVGCLAIPGKETALSKALRRIIAVVLVILLGLSIKYHFVLWAEWIALFVFAVHLIRLAFFAERCR